MATTYTTEQGDTFDGIAFKLYGNEGYMKDLIEANWRYADTLIFSAGVELTVPEEEISSVSTTAPFWRTESSSEDSEYYEYEEEPDDEEESEDLTDYESEDDDEGV